MPQHFLIPAPANLIADQAHPIAADPASATLLKHSPSHPDRLLVAAEPPIEHVDAALQAAADALPAWRDATIQSREATLQRFAELAADNADDLAKLMAYETGKPIWDCRAEAGLLARKVAATLDRSFEKASRNRVTDYEIQLSATRIGRTAFRPHGVMVVLGPFNFPAHLPNGHIVPALLAGNTVVFKPSDKAPATGQRLAEIYRQALAETDHHTGVVNLVHGTADVAKALVNHDAPAGILFTGSWPVGRSILQANLDRPGRIIALEMGGNSPAVVMPTADLNNACIEVVRGAFISAGQRCTCTRRLIVHRDIADNFIPMIARLASQLVIGDPFGEAGNDVFMGPLITADAARAVVNAQQRFIDDGARPILEARLLDHPSAGHYVSPAILQVDHFHKHDQGAGCDTEIFGPLLRLTTATSLDHAIEQANATRFGLAASIFTNEQHEAERFLAHAHAGCVNVNAATAGASGKLPFGGLGLSGNHRPAGAFALDYCAYPVASMIERDTTHPAASPGMPPIP